MFVFVGQRVVRGPDWEYNDDDGGDGCVGIVIKCMTGSFEDNSVTNLTNYAIKKVTVAWDIGHIGEYRTGQDGKYDLASLSIGPAGNFHYHVECSECQKDPRGYRWFCTVCEDYDLCDECYNDNKHDLDHQFARFASKFGSFVLAPTRESSASVRLEARGLIMGARVSKDGKQGIVTPMSKEMLLSGSVSVLWDWENEPTLYTRDDDTQRDFKCDVPARYCYYYKDHLANVGERNFHEVGDIAAVLMDVDQLKHMQEGHGDWNPRMADSLRQVGIIVDITYRSDCKLKHFGGAPGWESNPDTPIMVGYYNPDAVTKLEAFGIGDTVRLISDEERVKIIQPGHGDWKDEMSPDLGEEGTVVMVQESGDIEVLINGHPWTVHPASLTLIKADEQRSITQWEEAQQLIRQTTLDEALKEAQDNTHLCQSCSSINVQSDEIIRFGTNAHEGNLAAVKQALEKNPNWVNMQPEAMAKKTALHLACSGGHLEVIKYLLSKEADLEAIDAEGFRPLHSATFSKKLNVLEYILKQGAYPSVQANDGLSPLQLACQHSLTESAAMLLKYGCNINIQDSRGNVALHYAIVVESRECQELLIESPMIDLTLRNDNGCNALLFATCKDSDFAVNLIMDKMPALAANKRGDGHIALHEAVLSNKSNNSAIARILIEKGRCPVDALTNSNLTPLFMAVTLGRTKTVEVLVTQGANINLPSYEGRTSMHAVMVLQVSESEEAEDSLTLREIRASMQDTGVSSRVALACYLVKNGGKLDIPDDAGQTPMDLLDRVSDPKLKECLDKFLPTAR